MADGLKQRSTRSNPKSTSPVSTSSKTTSSPSTVPDAFKEVLDVPASATSLIVTSADGSKLYTEDAVRQVLRQDRRKRQTSKQDEILLWISIFLLGLFLGFGCHEMMFNAFAYLLGMKPASGKGFHA